MIQQIGRPQELYDAPVNLFVARFLGTANILEGASKSRAATCALSPVRARRCPAAAPWGGSVVLRPQNIAISAAAGPDTIAGRVLHSEFLGSQIRYIVRAAGAELVVDKSHHSSETAVPTGSDVALRVNMDSAVLLSA